MEAYFFEKIQKKIKKLLDFYYMQVYNSKCKEELTGKKGETKMKKYYVAEVQNRGSRRAATAIEAGTLKEAMKKAEELQAFDGTRLEIGTEVDAGGFLVDVIASKEDGEEWQE